MPKVILFVCLFVFDLHSTAQTIIITGEVRNGHYGDTVWLNPMPFGTAYYKKLSEYRVLDNAGGFVFQEADPLPHFYLLEYKEYALWILGCPDRPVHFLVDSPESKISGLGKKENELLGQLQRYSIFTSNGQNGSSCLYENMSADSLKRIAIPMMVARIDSAMRVIEWSDIHSDEKELLKTEIKYHYFNSFWKFLATGWSGRNGGFDRMLEIYRYTAPLFGLPPHDALRGRVPSACDFLSNDWDLCSFDATYTYSINHTIPNADSIFQANYGISYEERAKSLETYGNAYTEAVAASHKIPADDAFESWLCAKVMKRIDLGDLYSSSLLLDMLDSVDHQNPFLGRFNEWVGESEDLIHRMVSAPGIRFREDGGTVQSLEEFVAPYKGKVVVLGLWTSVGNGNSGWFEFNRDLEKRYTGKDVQFAYISEGNLDNWDNWLDTIYKNKLEGDHDMLDWHRSDDGGPTDSVRQLGAIPILCIYDKSGRPAVLNARWVWYKKQAYSVIDSLLSARGPAYGRGAEIGPGIRIRQDYLSISNLESLLKPYRGKVVYLDLWGTWCGPCLRQMQYEKALNKKYSGKDVVFLFVDQDGQEADTTWRRIIKEYDIRGEHVRMTPLQMAYLWGCLNRASDGYPSYFIFDRAGNLAEQSAKWPGDGAALYQQLDAALGKGMKTK